MERLAGLVEERDVTVARTEAHYGKDPVTNQLVTCKYTVQTLTAPPSVYSPDSSNAAILNTARSGKMTCLNRKGSSS